MSVRRHGGDVPDGPTYQEWRPAHLAGLVEVFWYFDGPTVCPRKRIFPTGTVELLVNLHDDPYRRPDGTGCGSAALPSAFVGGLHACAGVTLQPAWQTVLGVRLRPAGAHALLAMPVREVTGLVVGLRDLIGPAGDELAERCRAVRSPSERLGVAATWVAARIARGRGVDEAIAWLASRIHASGGTASVTALRQATGLPATRLRSAFHEQIGVTPKVYARLVRFGRALAMLQRGDRRLADVALDAGFYDQPHMNAEFRELGGLSPREFLAARHPNGDGTTAMDLRPDEA